MRCVRNPLCWKVTRSRGNQTRSPLRARGILQAIYSPPEEVSVAWAPPDRLPVRAYVRIIDTITGRCTACGVRCVPHPGGRTHAQRTPKRCTPEIPLPLHGSLSLKRSEMGTSHGTGSGLHYLTLCAHITTTERSGSVFVGACEPRPDALGEPLLTARST